jgi:DNA polymerase elongation subunit (family B)
MSIDFFYTTVARSGNDILYNGYDRDGNFKSERTKFEPTMYLECNSDAEDYYKFGNPNKDWLSIQGVPLKEMKFSSMKESTEFISRYNDTDVSIHGMSNYISQYIYNRYPNDIEYNEKFINVSNIDIEVESSGGFPDPQISAQPITAITVKDNENIYYVFGYRDYDVDKSPHKHLNIKYIRCLDEDDLLKRFINFWSSPKHRPDVITGWNIKFFDIPYIVNRVEKLLGKYYVSKISPWKIVRNRSAVKMGKEHQYYSIVGVEQVDYIDLYKKFTYVNRESYRLDHIAYVELGDRKLDYSEHSSLHELYLNDFQLYIDYNIKDVEIVDRLDDKLRLMSLCFTMAYKAGVNYDSVFGTTLIWDTYIYRLLCGSNMVPPPKKENIKSTFAGGYVKPPILGKHEWVVSFDLNSLYPMLLQQYNMSPETILPSSTSGVDVEGCLNMKEFDRQYDSTETTMAANGTHYRTDVVGVIPSVIDKLYSERRVIKSDMITLKKKREVEVGNDLDNNISSLHNQQLAIKIMMNALYGAMGNPYFRYYDLRIAEAVTLSGQLSIKWAEKYMNDYIDSILGATGGDYVVAIDTDSLYVNFTPLVSKLGLPVSDKSKVVDVLDKICKEKFEPMLLSAYLDLYNYMGCYENKMVMSREVIADVGIWTSKKRYILNVYDDEGVRYSTPKLKMMGIEAVRSSTPERCREKIKESLGIIINKNNDDLIDFIDEFRLEFKKMDIMDISFPRGINEGINKYYSSRDVYIKGTPIHVKGALFYNFLLGDLGLNSKYQTIKSGDKIKFCYLIVPNPINNNTISMLDVLPPEFKLNKYINYDVQFTKAFLDPIKTITDSIGWDVEHRNVLDDFL